MYASNLYSKHIITTKIYEVKCRECRHLNISLPTIILLIFNGHVVAVYEMYCALRERKRVIICRDMKGVYYRE